MYFSDQIQGVYRTFFIFNHFLFKKHCSSLHDIHLHCGFEPMIASDLLYGSLADINGYKDYRNQTEGEPNSRLKVIMALNSGVSHYLFGKHYFYQSICIRILALSCLVCKSFVSLGYKDCINQVASDPNSKSEAIMGSKPHCECV